LGGRTYNLAAVRKSDILYPKIILIIVCVHRNLTPASGDLADICEEVVYSTHSDGRDEKGCGKLEEKHLDLGASIEDER
jgi:hypothetical protein